MGIKYKVVAPAGQYTDGNGQTKTRYVDVGVIIETRTGLMLKAEAIPVGWDGTAFLNEPKPKQDRAAPTRAPTRTSGQQPRDEFSDDDLPF